MSKTAKASLTYHWKELKQQVRVEGVVELATEEESDNYFRTRPLQSKLGAWISHQSQPLTNRFKLLRDFASVSAKYAGKEIERPPHWGGYRIIPQLIEFWEEQPYRLHNRFQYTRTNGIWTKQRLAP